MKHVLITGSTRGIGLGLAKRFIEAGCKVSINGMTEESVSLAIQTLQGIYPLAEIQGFAGDAGNYREVEMMWDQAVSGFGEIDIWINNAGIDQERKYAWEIESAAFERIMRTNLLGVFNGSTAAFKRMLEQGKGQIFNMEGFGSDGMMREKMTLYGTTKSAVRYFSRSLAKEAGKTPIRVGTLSPGMVVTDFLLKSAQANPDAEKNKRLFNILADDVDTVTRFLSAEVLKNEKNNCHLVWLTQRKVLWRFLRAPFMKRDLFR
ncbi:bile acid 7-dehydroxylase 2 [Peptococcaceae bacterium CEB3]|nr:bile acid 7-dehydroxylase 2 [Peptococcaceae bacterium CEB3]